MAARISPTNPRPEINTRQELFCRLIAEGRSQYESYTEAGFKATTRGVADAEACKLLKAPKITARVKEIQAENALAARISVASVTKMYVESTTRPWRTTTSVQRPPRSPGSPSCTAWSSTGSRSRR